MPPEFGYQFNKTKLPLAVVHPAPEAYSFGAFSSVTPRVARGVSKTLRETEDTSLKEKTGDPVQDWENDSDYSNDLFKKAAKEGKRGFLGSIFLGGKLSGDDIRTDDSFIKAARVFYEWKVGKAGATDEEVTKRFMRYLRLDENNLTWKGKNAIQLSMIKDPAVKAAVKKAIRFGKDAMEQKKNTIGGSALALVQNVADPINWATGFGLSAALKVVGKTVLKKQGFSFIAKGGFQKLGFYKSFAKAARANRFGAMRQALMSGAEREAAKAAGRAAFRKMAVKGVGIATGLSAVEGVVSGVLDDQVRQRADIDLGRQHKFSYARMGATVATSMGMGLFMAGGGDILKFRKLGRGGDGKTTWIKRAGRNNSGNTDGGAPWIKRYGRRKFETFKTNFNKVVEYYQKTPYRQFSQGQLNMAGWVHVPIKMMFTLGTKVRGMLPRRGTKNTANAQPANTQSPNTTANTSPPAGAQPGQQPTANTTTSTSTATGSGIGLSRAGQSGAANTPPPPTPGAKVKQKGVKYQVTDGFVSPRPTDTIFHKFLRWNPYTWWVRYGPGESDQLAHENLPQDLFQRNFLLPIVKYIDDGLVKNNLVQEVKGVESYLTGLTKKLKAGDTPESIKKQSIAYLKSWARTSSNQTRFQSTIKHWQKLVDELEIKEAVLDKKVDDAGLAAMVKRYVSNHGGNEAEMIAEINLMRRKDYARINKSSIQSVKADLEERIRIFKDIGTGKPSDYLKTIENVFDSHISANTSVEELAKVMDNTLFSRLTDMGEPVEVRQRNWDGYKNTMKVSARKFTGVIGRVFGNKKAIGRTDIDTAFETLDLPLRNYTAGYSNPHVRDIVPSAADFEAGKPHNVENFFIFVADVENHGVYATRAQEILQTYRIGRDADILNAVWHAANRAGRDGKKHAMEIRTALEDIIKTGDYAKSKHFQYFKARLDTLIDNFPHNSMEHGQRDMYRKMSLLFNDFIIGNNYPGTDEWATPFVQKFGFGPLGKAKEYLWKYPLGYKLATSTEGEGDKAKTVVKWVYDSWWKKPPEDANWLTKKTWYLNPRNMPSWLKMLTYRPLSVVGRPVWYMGQYAWKQTISNPYIRSYPLAFLSVGAAVHGIEESAEALTGEDYELDLAQKVFFNPTLAVTDFVYGGLFRSGAGIMNWTADYWAYNNNSWFKFMNHLPGSYIYRGANHLGYKESIFNPANWHIDPNTITNNSYLNALGITPLSDGPNLAHVEDLVGHAAYFNQLNIPMVAHNDKLYLKDENSGERGRRANKHEIEEAHALLKPFMEQTEEAQSYLSKNTDNVELQQMLDGRNWHLEDGTVVDSNNNPVDLNAVLRIAESAKNLLETPINNQPSTPVVAQTPVVEKKADTDGDADNDGAAEKKSNLSGVFAGLSEDDRDSLGATASWVGDGLQGMWDAASGWFSGSMKRNPEMTRWFAIMAGGLFGMSIINGGGTEFFKTSGKILGFVALVLVGAMIWKRPGEGATQGGNKFVANRGQGRYSDARYVPTTRARLASGDNRTTYMDDVQDHNGGTPGTYIDGVEGMSMRDDDDKSGKSGEAGGDSRGTRRQIQANDLVGNFDQQAQDDYELTDDDFIDVSDALGLQSTDLVGTFSAVQSANPGRSHLPFNELSGQAFDQPGAASTGGHNLPMDLQSNIFVDLQDDRENVYTMALDNKNNMLAPVPGMPAPEVIQRAVVASEATMEASV